MDQQIVDQGLYRHYKGNIYKVLMTARHTETSELMVIYQDKSRPDLIWTRPLNMFLEEVMINNQKTPRFEYVG
jgi:hypothetical protein